MKNLNKYTISLCLNLLGIKTRQMFITKTRLLYFFLFLVVMFTIIENDKILFTREKHSVRMKIIPIQSLKCILKVFKYLKTL